MAAGDDWRYNPSHALAYVAIALFAVTFVAQVGWLVKKRSYYMIPFAIACLGEAVGYGFRRVSADHPTGRHAGLTWYILQELFIILCPALMAASYYMCFGRIITYVGAKWTPISPKWVTAIFVTVDVVSFCVQGAGGSLYSSDNVSIYPTAKAVLLVGFIIQIIGLGIFSIFAIIYHVRAIHAGVPHGPWSTCLYTLYLGSALVIVRGIFRTIEFGTGKGGGKGYLLENEGWYYGLEALPILLACILLSISYPGSKIPHSRAARMFPPTEAELAAQDEETRIAAERSDSSLGEKRRFWQRKA